MYMYYTLYIVLEQKASTGTCFTECDIVDVSIDREVMWCDTEFSTTILVTSMASYHSENHNLQWIM